MVDHFVLRPLFARGFRVLKSARVRALMSLGMVLGLGGVGTLAVWSTSATATSGAFITGSVDIKIDDSDRPVATPYLFALDPATLLPGQSAAAVIAVQNRGTLAFNYGVGVFGTGNLTNALSVSAMPGGTASGSATNKTCTGGTARPAVTPGTATAPAVLIPDASVGKVAAAAGNATLCVQVTLPRQAQTALQGMSSTMTFLFTATGDTSA